MPDNMSGDLFWLLLLGLTDCCFSAEPPQPPAQRPAPGCHRTAGQPRPGPAAGAALPSPAQSFLSLCLAQRSRSLPQPDPATAAPAPLRSLATARSGWSPAPAPDPRTPTCACSPPSAPGAVWPQLVDVAAAVVAILPPPAPAWSPLSSPAWVPGTPLYSDSDL